MAAIEQKLNEQQGHWILARLGKRVLRPGGRELTNKMIEGLQIGEEDDLVEFAPGVGFTASLACAKNPRSYTGVDRNKEALALADKRVHHPNKRMILADASDTGLPAESATKVYGEAMLTMQSKLQKKAIVQEAARVLKPGGYYGMHELSLYPDDVSEEIKRALYRDLSLHIKVSARPLTTKEWTELLESEGFQIVSVAHNPMYLLEFKRMIQDEGLPRTLKIAFNLLTHPRYLKRVKQMRATFRRYYSNMQAIAIVARKKHEI